MVIELQTPCLPNSTDFANLRARCGYSRTGHTRLLGRPLPPLLVLARIYIRIYGAMGWVWVLVLTRNERRVTFKGLREGGEEDGSEGKPA